MAFPQQALSARAAPLPSIPQVGILIVGAGFAGASTAYHLVQRGHRDVLIVEQEETCGAHSSGRSAAMIREHADDPAEQQMVSEGARFCRSGRMARYERNGMFLVGFGTDDASMYFGRARGLGRMCRDDGTIDAAGLLQSYLQGIEVRLGVRVEEWSYDGGGFDVATSAGAIRCQILVNAAGPWAGELGRIPLTPMNRHLFVTPPMAWVDRRWPCIWDGPHGLYFRPESGGLLLCCCDETPARPGEYTENPALLDELDEKLGLLQPGLGQLSVARSWVGQRTFASDRRFVIGWDPRVAGLFHVAGLGGHGVTASWSVGRVAAALIDGEYDERAADFQPDRLLKDIERGDCDDEHGRAVAGQRL